MLQTLPMLNNPQVDEDLSPAQMEALSFKIRQLAKEQNAVILAHNYQRPEVQDVADYVGDSLGLSRQAEATSADKIIFCGVHFMAETASILNPTKKVLIPDLKAGCSLADGINARQLMEWKAQYPDAIVVSYVNTTAEVKALSDYCCTSGNAESVIRAIPEDKTILFLPDMFLGAYLEKATGRKMKIWVFECHVHAGIRYEDLQKVSQENQDADVLIHPECGCASSAMYASTEVDSNINTFLLSTEKMITHVKNSPKKNFVIATETGIIHRLQKEAPGKTFIPASKRAVCQYMKMITLPKILESLQQDIYEVRVPEEIAAKARLSLERMVSIG